MDKEIQTATFGAGCFWCIDAAFRNVLGVNSVKSGYAGGAIKNPSYQQICSGLTNHAEVIQIKFDETKISFEVLLDMLFTLHNPTQLNRQGNDIGTQYRSVVFYHNDAQKNLAEQAIIKYQPHFSTKIVTEITPASEFYLAENYHQDYYAANQEQPYCSMLIGPKIKKLKEEFIEYLK
jgi:peptide-methionine (S)-S-oxide reductase